MSSKKNEGTLPQHVGFIMDGNRRWGEKNKKNKLLGHHKGAEQLEVVSDFCLKKGIKYMTIFAFSAENWGRPKEEISELMVIFKKGVKEKLKDLNKSGIKVNVIGRIDDFEKDTQKLLKKAVETTQNNTKAILNVALSYGGRAEIVDAAKKIIEKGISAKQITEELFAKYLYESGQPDLDLIVRTGGVQRLSGFMLWQSAYSELYFTDKLWPDLDEKELEKALEFYAETKRNFGK